MKILFDLLSQQDNFINGGSLYGFRLLTELISKGVEIAGIYDSTKNFNSDVEKLVKEKSIDLIDFRKDLAKYCKDNDIKAVVITIAQRFNDIDLTKIECDIYIVCHDVTDLILYDIDGCYAESRLTDFRGLVRRSTQGFSILRKIKRAVGEKLSLWRFNRNKKGIENIVEKKNYDKLKEILNYSNFQQLIKMENVHVITVSKFSKTALEYYFDNIANEIKVFHAHSKIITGGGIGKEVGQFIEKKYKYLLLISTNRFNKNLFVFLKQYEKLKLKLGNEYKYVFIGGVNFKDENVFVFNNVTADELNLLYKNAQIFIYPSLGEGYGSPPVEAMSFGTPVIASYCTSVPEVLGDSVVFFNPFYHVELYMAILKVLDNREEYIEKSKAKYLEIKKDQEKNLENLLEYIMN